MVGCSLIGRSWLRLFKHATAAVSGYLFLFYFSVRTCVCFVIAVRFVSCPSALHSPPTDRPTDPIILPVCLYVHRCVSARLAFIFESARRRVDTHTRTHARSYVLVYVVVGYVHFALLTRLFIYLPYVCTTRLLIFAPSALV